MSDWGSGYAWTERLAREMDKPNDDPLFDIVLMAAAGAEDEARDTYGDRVVDSAIGRVLREDGWQ